MQDQRKIRILLVDPHTMVRVGLKLLLDSQTGLSVVADAASASEAVQKAIEFQPDVILLELALGEDRGIDCLPQLLRMAPKANVLILTGVYDIGVHLEAVSAGAKGIVRKMEAGDVLVKAIRKVVAGEVYLDGALMARVLYDLWMPSAHSSADSSISEKASSTVERKFGDLWRPAINVEPDIAAKIAQLTEREREVITLVGEGLRNQQIADRLTISVITVRHHLSSIFAKLDVGDRFELAIYSYRHGLAKPPL